MLRPTPTVRSVHAGRRARGHRIRAILLASFASAVSAPGVAAQEPTRPDPALTPEPYDAGWAFYLDNDALALVNRDQQYTGGFALTLSGRRALDYAISPMPALQGIDRWLGLADLGDGERRNRAHALHFGMAAFTPEDIGTARPLPEQRPYASLAFVTATTRRALLDRDTVYQSSLLLGVLGSDIPASVQSAIHRNAGFQEARGWDNQISDGGEPTAAYVATHYHTRAFETRPGWGDYQVQTIAGAGIGAFTQAGVGVSLRYGEIRTPWWSYTPGYTEFISLGPPLSARGMGGHLDSELYFTAGLSMRYRVYNALLQGQFRDSRVTYDRSQLNEVLLELNLGVVAGITADTGVALVLNARTPEISDPEEDTPLWGSLVLWRVF